MFNKHWNKNPNSGFSMLEVLVAIVAVGILAAYSAPSWLAFIDTIRLNVASEKIYLALRDAQRQAQKTKTTWQFSLREQDNVVQWAIHPEKQEITTITWNNLDSNVNLDEETTLRFQQSTNLRKIQFDYKGSVKKPPLGRITLSSKYGGKAKRCVFISTILGAIRAAKERDRPKTGTDDYCY